MTKILLFTFLSLALSACGTLYNHTIPVEDITTSTTEDIPEKIDLDTVDISINESQPNEIITYSNAKPSDIKSKAPSTISGPMVKPIEITSVNSKPANQLLEQANQAADSGDYNKANVLLDRALSISPRDPKLWHKKAQIMYYKSDYRQASSMAMRSNTMTQNSSLKKQNWRIIANAREKMGDLSGAEQAKRFAQQ